LRLFPKRAGFVQFRLDAVGPLVEHPAQHRRHVEVEQYRQEQKEADQHHEIGVEERGEIVARRIARLRRDGRQGEGPGDENGNEDPIHLSTPSSVR
jgi:hypothetical protein